jgi:putative inorganic carbon (hco3(-)) transporter
MLMMMWLIVKTLWDFRRPLNSSLTNTDIKYILHGAIAVMLALLAEGFFEYNLGDSEILTMFFVVAAFAYIAVENIASTPQMDYKK